MLDRSLQQEPVAAIQTETVNLSAFSFSVAAERGGEPAPDKDAPPVETPSKPDVEPDTGNPPAEPAPTPHEHPSEVPCEPGPCRW